jgi:hypothetical protein
MGITLLPSAAVNGKTKVASFVHKRIVDVTLQGYALQASSDAETGTLTKIEVYNKDTQELVLTHNCSGYSCSVDISGLAAGTYIAKVYTTLTTYSESFNKH